MYSAISVLGTPLLLTTYSSLEDLCRDHARSNSCVAIEFANTQIVTMRRHDATFREQTNAMDYYVPDGMPLVWCLNFAGAGLSDRVYGPTFMRRFLADLPSLSTHYLLGGSPDTGDRLRSRFAEVNPKLRFVGSFHGTCHADGVLEGKFDDAVVDEINRLAPDFIWLGLGAPKQELWIKRRKHLIRRGVILAVGFAFDVNAGTKPDAPGWMQQRGLTWVFRLWSEPRRLGSRYLRYNSLFLWYLLIDALRSRAFGARFHPGVNGADKQIPG
jgi:N-acetylglucosaminyldiphosphoundecaprenol N-acetyl-beta-D-mannosaminyltransferase